MATKQATTFSAEVLDQLLSGRDPTTVLESDGLIGDLKEALAERMLNAEMDVHLGSDGELAAGNHRNGPAQHRRWLEKPTHPMAQCQGPVRHPVRRTLRDRSMTSSTGSHTEFLTHPLTSIVPYILAPHVPPVHPFLCTAVAAPVRLGRCGIVLPARNESGADQALWPPPTYA